MRLFTTITGLRCYLDLKRSGQEQPSEDGASIGTSPTSPQMASRQTLSSHPITSSHHGSSSRTIGFVPTMGALHQGHLSLVERAKQENDIVVVSIFVNPLQFGPHEDFHRYPRPLEHDRQLCEQAGVDVIFAPTVAELYGTPYVPLSETLTQVIPSAAMISPMCGRFRPGHFQGVATVVTKLLNIVQPERAYFGQKDAQQLAILRQMVADLNMPIEVIGCPIVREPSGLAMSSRNQYLSETEREQATVIYRSLHQAEQAFYHGKRLREELINVVETELARVPLIKPEYIELVHPDTMMPLEQIEEVGLLAIAAHLGSTRLIDNVILQNRKPILAIDGPAGAGKSTVARQVAQKLDLLYLDTGAMYRAVTWLVLQSGISVDDRAAIAELVSRSDIQLESKPVELGRQNPETVEPSALQVWINGQEVTQAIRSSGVTAQVSVIAAQPLVRQELVQRQQAYGRRGGIVMDGRDIGTCVFPNAELKIFLTASVQERARRRQQDLRNQGQLEVTLEELEQAINERDCKDSTRTVSPLQKATDAIEIQTDNLSVDEVVAKIVALYHEKLAAICLHSA